MQCEIRTMVVSDIEAMVAVFDTVVSALPGYLTASELQEGVALAMGVLSPQRADRWRESLLALHTAYPDGQFVAVDAASGALVGFQVVERAVGPHTSYGILQDFCVLPYYRNGGVGRRLFQAALDQLAADGISRIFFESGCDNHAFHGWASRWGFRPVSLVFMADSPVFAPSEGKNANG